MRNIFAAVVILGCASMAHSQSFEQQLAQAGRLASETAREAREERKATAPAPAAQRKQFLDALSAFAGLSQSQKLVFTQVSLQDPAPRKVHFTLTVGGYGGYKDSFFVEFKSPGQKFETLVAYEGLNGHLMGALTVTSRGDAVVYKHVFDGFLDDTLILTVVKGKVTKLVYDKINPQGVSFFSLTYQAN